VFGANNIWTACYGAEDPTACSLIHRKTPGTGQLWVGAGNVEDTNVNIGSMKTTGYDINIGYHGG
jgi:hypothetical protein